MSVPTTSHELKFLYSLLLGETEAFVQCSFTLEMKWFEIFPTYLLFAHPTAQIRDVGSLAKVSITKKYSYLQNTKFRNFIIR